MLVLMLVLALLLLVLLVVLVPVPVLQCFLLFGLVSTFIPHLLLCFLAS